MGDAAVVLLLYHGGHLRPEVLAGVIAALVLAWVARKYLGEQGLQLYNSVGSALVVLVSVILVVIGRWSVNEAILFGLLAVFVVYVVGRLTEGRS